MCKQENDSELVPGIVILCKNTKFKYSTLIHLPHFVDEKIKTILVKIIT